MLPLRTMLKPIVYKKRHLFVVGTIILLSLFFFLIVYYSRRRNERLVQEKEALLRTHKLLTEQHSALSSQMSDLNVQMGLIEQERAQIRNQYIQLCQSYFTQIGRINEILNNSGYDSDNNLYKDLKKVMQRFYAYCPATRLSIRKRIWPPLQRYLSCRNTPSRLVKMGARL